MTSHSLILVILLVIVTHHVSDSKIVDDNSGRYLMSPARRAAIVSRCSRVRRDCVSSGDIFKRSVVCAGGKRFLNACALQLRSCDLGLNNENVLEEERCFWMWEDNEEGEGGDEEEQGGTEEDIDLEGGEEGPGEEDIIQEGDEGEDGEDDVISEEETDRKPPEHIDENMLPRPDTGNRLSCCRGDVPTCPSCTRRSRGGPVCGSDGVTYETECALDTEACAALLTDLYAVSRGSCPEPPRGNHGRGPPMGTPGQGPHGGNDGPPAGDQGRGPPMDTPGHPGPPPGDQGRGPPMGTPGRGPPQGDQGPPHQNPQPGAARGDLGKRR